MAKNKQSISVEVDPAKAGVVTRHHLRMETDQEYRDNALTPPGGKAPGEAGKDPMPTPNEPTVTPAVLAASL